MEAEALFENPLRVGSLYVNRLENSRENTKQYRTVVQSKNKVSLGTFGDEVELWKIESGKQTEIFGLVPAEEYVGYYVCWERQDADFIDVDWATQVLVWAGILPSTRGLPDKIFFEYVLQETGAVVSDSEQSDRGEHFWQRMIAQAFRTGLKVYLVDFGQKKTIRIKTHRDYVRLYESENSPWGNRKGFHNGLRIAIADFDFTQE